jgi:hypothetical protein
MKEPARRRARAKDHAVRLASSTCPGLMAAGGLGQNAFSGQATAAGSSTMSRVRAGSIFTPGLVVVVSVTECR